MRAETGQLYREKLCAHLVLKQSYNYLQGIKDLAKCNWCAFIHENDDRQLIRRCRITNIMKEKTSEYYPKLRTYKHLWSVSSLTGLRQCMKTTFNY